MDVVVVGGGFAGLGAALFMARRGLDVTVIERDGAPTGATADDDAQHWQRPGAPQSRQTHLLLGKAHRVLATEAPDVIHALVQRGVGVGQVRFGPGVVPDEQFLMSRRLVAEAVLRRAVESEPRVTFVIDAVAGLSVSDTGHVPVATGVTLASGSALSAPLVVDAGGRRSALPDWLAAVGARPPIDQTQQCGFFYATRYYRVRPACSTPVTRIPASVALDYATVLPVGADNGTFSITATLSTDDPHRRRITEPQFFTEFLQRVPWAAQWLAVGDPISDVATMSRIENRRRSIVDDDGPIIGGVVSLGDAALHTNPTLGRGMSLALWHAQHLANEAGGAADDPVGFVQRFHDWTAEHLAPWFDTQVSNDAAGLARLQAGLRGERLPPPDDPMTAFVNAAFASGQSDPVVGRAVASVVHLLAPPSVAFADPDVAARIGRHLADQPTVERAADQPTRAEFETLALA
ncbi:MAG: hypothetical protein JWN99_188 [Ilumatobacteraceae bacterium]|nr:hypothetical protein [Ilumatobacteraceae bacterium]